MADETNYAQLDKMHRELGVQAQVLIDMHREDPAKIDAEVVLNVLLKRYDTIAAQQGGWQ